LSRYVKIGFSDPLTPVRGVEVRFRGEHGAIFLDDVYGYNPSDVVYGTYRAEGDMSVLAIKGHVNPVLKAVLGVETPDDPETPTKYTYTLSDPQAFMMEIGISDSEAYYSTYTYIRSLRTTLEPREAVRFECDLLIRKVMTFSYDYVEPSAGKPYIVWNTTVSIDGTNISAKRVEFTIDRGISDDDMYVIGDKYFSELVFGETNISGSITLAGSAKDTFLKALFGDSSATEPLDEPPTVSITINAKTPDGNDYMKISIPKVAIQNAELRMRGKEPLERTFEWRAVGDDISVEVSA